MELRKFISQYRQGSRSRVLVETPRAVQEEIASQLMRMLSLLSSVCWTENSFGLVGASKVLFAVLPEVALPIDNAEWKKVFQCHICRLLCVKDFILGSVLGSV